MGVAVRRRDQKLVYDCFMYTGEHEALQIRLHELDDVVDKFIIIEGNQTFRENPKPFYLDEVWEDIEPWHDRIHRVPVEYWPEINSPWDAEHFQRDQVRRGLKEVGASGEDIVIVSDADEIPRASVVKRANLWNGHVHLDFDTYYFNFDWKVPDKWNLGGRPFMALYVQMGSPQEMRDDQRRLILDGGWHFSYFGYSADIKTKIQSFAHSEYDTLEYTDLKRLEVCVKEGIDPFGRFLLEPVEIDDTYPKYVQENYV